MSCENIRDSTATSFSVGNNASVQRIHNPTRGIVKNTRPLVAAIIFHDNSLLNVSVASKGHKYRPSKKEVYLMHESGEVPWDVLGTADFKRQNMTEVRLYGEITNLGLDNVVIGNKRNLGFSCPQPPAGHGLVLFHEVNCN